MNLYEVRLGPGAHKPMDVAWPIGNSGSARPKYDVPPGYDGLRFIGAGKDQTHILPEYDGATSWDATVFVGPHTGVAWFEGMTIHCGPRKGMHVGLANSDPDFKPLSVVWRDVAMVADPPPGGVGHTTVWGLFSYQSYIDLEDSEFFMAHSAEHASYSHGYSQRAHEPDGEGFFPQAGSRWVRVTVHASGAENDKETARPSEAVWVPGCISYRFQCRYQGWYQPWTWRGGAGITRQGTGADIAVEDCMFFGRLDGQHSRCFMVDDSGNDFYGPDGQPGVGAANRNIAIRDCGLGGQGPDWHAPIARLGTLTQNPDKPVALSLTCQNSGFFGPNTNFQVKGVERGIRFEGCNTPAITNQGYGYGFDAGVETNLSVDTYYGPVSEWTGE